MRGVKILFCILGAAASGSAYAAPQSTVRGLVRSEVTATISSDLVAQIHSLPFKAGQSFRKGSPLVIFDCRRYEADRRALRAEAKSHEIMVKTNRQLLKYRAAGANDLAIAESKLAQIQAKIEALNIRMGQCKITAPFDGRVVEHYVDLFELPQANTPLIKIVKDGRLELDLIVPSNWMTWLKRGEMFRFRIDETKTEHAAKVLFLGAVIDPISRTMKVSAELRDPVAIVRPGMSGVARFSLPKD